MLRATFTARRRGADTPAVSNTPAWFLNGFTPWLQSASKWACTHPIYTVLCLGIMASTSYISLLETSLFEPPASTDMVAGGVDSAALLSGSKTLHASPQNGWKWQNGESDMAAVVWTHSLCCDLSLLMYSGWPGSCFIHSSLPRHPHELCPSTSRIIGPVSATTKSRGSACL